MLGFPCIRNLSFVRSFATARGGRSASVCGLTSSVFIAPHPQKHKSPFADVSVEPLIVSPQQRVPRYREAPDMDLIECVRFRTQIGYQDDERQRIEFESHEKEEISKTYVGGEDAYMVVSGGKENKHMLCLSDGVSSWRYTAGIDSGCFARKLVSAARDTFVDQEDILDSHSIFWNAVNTTLKSGTPGSATLTICTLLKEENNDQVLDITQLGDCGILILRQNKQNRGYSVVYRSTPQLIAMDTPVQISSLHSDLPSVDESTTDEGFVNEVSSLHIVPIEQVTEAETILKLYPSFKKTGTLVSVQKAEERSCVPEDTSYTCIHNGLTLSQLVDMDTDVTEIRKTYYPIRPSRTRVNVLPNDIIQLGSDGVFDNQFDQEILGICNSMLLKHTSEDPYYLDTVAQNVGEACIEACLDKKKDTPYAQAARDDFVLWNGGRIDDICQIVSRVQ